MPTTPGKVFAQTIVNQLDQLLAMPATVETAAAVLRALNQADAEKPAPFPEPDEDVTAWTEEWDGFLYRLMTKLQTIGNARRIRPAHNTLQ
jgi:hypothetical protein